MGVSESCRFQKASWSGGDGESQSGTSGLKSSQSLAAAVTLGSEDLFPHPKTRAKGMGTLRDPQCGAGPSDIGVVPAKELESVVIPSLSLPISGLG